MTGNDVICSDEKAKQLLSRLGSYAKEHNLSNRRLAEEIDIPYDTLREWHYFTQRKRIKYPSKENVEKISKYLESKGSTEDYKQVEEAQRKAEKIKYLLLLLEDELRWFRDSDPGAREQFRKALDAYDIGYISSLLTMLTEEEKFRRWLALTTTRFNSFKRR